MDFTNKATWIPFTPRPDDVLIASLSSVSSNAAPTLLSGKNGMLNGIQYGYFSDTLTITPNNFTINYLSHGKSVNETVVFRFKVAGKIVPNAVCPPFRDLQP